MRISEFFAMADGQPADANGSYRARLVAIEQVGDAATALLEEEGYWGSVSFTDFFSLVRVDGDWNSSARRLPIPVVSLRLLRLPSPA